ncbi:MAG: o-succinylbenzoate synthase [Gammaproteobacteria bacterium]|nr:o-succinylbenzoate synthase [Gammaproteobacteria bacterium]
MNIQSIKAIPYSLPLSKVWRSTQGSFKSRKGWLIVISSDTGLRGYGDCAPMPEAGTETKEQAQICLHEKIKAESGNRVDTVFESLALISDCPATRCGLETALLDVLSKNSGLPLYRYLNEQIPGSEKIKPGLMNTIQVNSNPGSVLEVSPEILAKQTASIIKFKLGIDTPEKEMAALKKISSELEPGVQLRLDANQAWTFSEASKFIAACRGLPIESLEEPLQQPDPQQLEQLQKQCSFPLAIDESMSMFEPETLIEQTRVERIVIKPMREGGLVNSLKLARQAYAANMDVVITTTVDSAAGTWAATQLAAALGRQGQNVAHGLATSDWLSHDLGLAPIIKSGYIQLDETPGLGFEPFDKVER